MYTTPLQNLTLENLSHLPSYAAYLLKNRLNEFAAKELELSRELNLSLLKPLSHLDETEVLESIKSHTAELLDLLAKNKGKEQIDLSLNRWLKTHLPYTDRVAVKAEDIHTACFILKSCFMHFMKDYTEDLTDVIKLVKDIDYYIMHLQLSTAASFIKMLKENAEHSVHFVHKVNDTIPGAVYVFDLVNFKGIFANKKIAQLMGYQQEESPDHGTMIRQLVHPADRDLILQKTEEVKKAADHEIISFKYRLRQKDGYYRWMRNFESVFKRNEKGEAIESIGIALDVDREHRAADALKENEKLYKRAEALTHIGSYVWELATNKLKWSEELYHIYGLDASVGEISFELAGSFNHPDDIQLVRKSYQEAIASKKPFDFYYRINAKDNKQKILHARGELIPNENGEIVTAIGTVQDVTEKQALIRKLEHSEAIHKQAEELTNMGSWTWDLATNHTEWSEQMYKIYEIDTPVHVDVFKDFIHPDDKEKASSILRQLLKEKFSDHSFRIITKSGKIKTLHTIARVHLDSSGQPAYIVGAEQDITEKENLLEKLKKTEQVYKQAEELANMGNWSWDVKTGKVEWTDQLYRIYGLEPQSEEISLDRFISFIHPDDRERISLANADIYNKDILDHTFRIITQQGNTRILRSVAQVQRAKDGTPLHVVGSERDITDKQTMIDKLKRSENLYKQAQMLAHVGNWTWHIETDILEWSDEMYRIYGLAPQSITITYNLFIDLIHPEDKEKVKAQVQSATETGASWEFTHRLVRKSGEVRILQATGEVLRDENGKPYMMFGTAQDITERQLLIDKLQESEKFFKQAQSLAHLGSWTMDVRTKEFSWSDEMYNIFEVSSNEHFDFERWVGHIDAEERDEVLAYYEECLREKKIYDKVHHIRLHNGKVKTVHRKGEFILDEQGNPVKMIGTTQDITEDDRIQQELKENQVFIRKITDATPSIIASYNINTGQYVFISEGLEKLLGYAISNVMDKGAAFFTEVIHPEDFPVVMERNGRALEEANADASKNDMVVEFSYRMKHSNGQYRWFHTYGTIFDRNKEGKVEHVLNISLDITEQINASQTIKEQEHFIKQIADASPTILYLYDVEKQSIVYINREIFFVLGYAPDEIVAMKDNITKSLYHPEDYILLPARNESRKNFQQVDSMIQYECRMKNKQEDWKWLLVREIVFKTDTEGNITQILGAALDINRRKEMEKTILQNTLLLEQSNASLEEFAYVASHDLKEPLRKISTFGDRLVASQADKLSSDGNIYLQKIIDASQRMQTMINDLLSISMITGNTAFEQYSLQKILHETLQTLEHKIEQQNAVITSDPLPEAYIIPFQFRQLFQNLLSNSLKFVNPGVQPQINISHVLIRAEDINHFQVTKADHYHKICFSDNGIGFDNEYAGKIFAIFQRLHGRSEYEGSGIGLAICKKIVEHHGGIIYASGEEGKGAMFTIILPA